MAKQKTTFFCNNCGAQHSQWLGFCKYCKQYNTITEEIVEQSSNQPKWRTSNSKKVNQAQNIQQIQQNKETRIPTANQELNRVLGGGMVQGSVILLGGEPGIGKSTLLLQIVLATKQIKSLYVSGEESASQIKYRADRIGIQSNQCHILTETKTAQIFNQCKQIQPNLLVIDSIQTLQTNTIESAAGSVSQIRACTAELIQFAKQTQTPVILVGHITKDGQIAGPKVLEHMVDVVLQFEGDRNHLFRILRAHKNRYGSTAEIGIYEMKQDGLAQVKNPSQLFLNNSQKELSGNAVAATIEGIRPMLIEIQALVSTAVYGTPQRSNTGFDAKRLNMLLAVLEKRAGFHLASKDVFLNITGGIKIEDPALDLAVISAILSSNADQALPSNCCFAGEVGLSGEIRPVNRIEQRILEAEKMGFDVIFVADSKTIKTSNYQIRVQNVAQVGELVQLLL